MIKSFLSKLNFSSDSSQKSLFSSLIFYSLCLLSFLVPLFFLPFTSDAFEFNKLILISVFTLFLGVLWGIRAVKEGKLEFTSSPLNLATLILLGVFVAGTIFSQNWIYSLAGQYGRWQPSLFFIIILVFLFNLVTANIEAGKEIRGILNSLYVGLVVASSIGLIRFLLPSSVKFPLVAVARGFTTVGSPSVLAALAGITFALSLVGILQREVGELKGWLVIAIRLFGALVSLALVIFLNLPVGWASLISGILAVLLSTGKERIVKKAIPLVIILVFSIILGVVRFVPTIYKGMDLPTDYPKEIFLGWRNSWLIASSAFRDFPIFGSGPSTFLTDFTRYRPLSYNYTQMWGVRFDRPQSEYFHILATLGLAGVLAAVFLALKIVKMDSLRDPSLASVNAIILPLAVILVFLPVTVPLFFVFFLALAILVAIRKIEGSMAHNISLKVDSLKGSLGRLPLRRADGGANILGGLFFVLTSVIALVGFYFTFRLFTAEIWYRKAALAVSRNDGLAAYKALGKSINAFPYYDSYRRDYAKINLALANMIAGKKELTDQDKANVSQLISQALREIKVATEVLGAGEVSNWEARASIYRSILGVAQNADIWAINAYQTAIQLDPGNPLLRLNLGGLYYAKKDYDSAVGAFSSATAVKNDYANAHYNLAVALKEKGDLKGAKTELEVTQSLLEKDSADYKKVSEDIAAIGGLEESKPTVEEIEKGKEREAQKPQLPLTKPGEEATSSAEGR